MTHALSFTSRRKPRKAPRGRIHTIVDRWGPRFVGHVAPSRFFRIYGIAGDGYNNALAETINGLCDASPGEAPRPWSSPGSNGFGSTSTDCWSRSETSRRRRSALLRATRGARHAGLTQTKWPPANPGVFQRDPQARPRPTGRKARRSALQRRAAESCARSSGLAIFLIQAIGVGPIDRSHDGLHIVGGLGSEIHLVGVLEHVENQDRLASGDALSVIVRP